MLRLRTKVTSSPTTCCRSRSANSATATTSGPRASNRVTSSSMPGSWPSSTPASTSATAVPAWDGPGTRTVGARSAPEYHAVERRPIWMTSAPVPTLAAASCRSGKVAPGIVAAHRLRVGAVQDGEPDVLVEPRAGVAGELRVDRQARRQGQAPRLDGRAQHVDVRPRPLGVHVVGGDGRDAAEVVDAGVDERTRIVHEVGRRLQVHVGGQDRAGQRDRLERGRRASRRACRA